MTSVATLYCSTQVSSGIYHAGNLCTAPKYFRVQSLQLQISCQIMLLPFLVLLCQAALFLPCSANLEISQQPFLITKSNETRIAIIGAGIAGASAAFRLQTSPGAGKTPALTIYESEAIVGGPIHTLPRQFFHHRHVEDGAQSFHKDDWCITTTLSEIGLQHVNQEIPSYIPKSSGVWNGSSLTSHLRCDVDDISWWHLWKYGLSSWRYRHAVRVIAAKWRSFGKNIFTNLLEELDDTQLDRSVYQSAES